MPYMRGFRPEYFFFVPLLGSAACSEYSYTSKINRDVFQQQRINTVDVLMVVDNSCSMDQEQDKLASNFQAFIDAFEGVEVDWQLSVVTTDMWDADGQGTMLGGDDEIELQSPGGQTIDRVAWNRRPSPRAAASASPMSFSVRSSSVSAIFCRSHS